MNDFIEVPMKASLTRKDVNARCSRQWYELSLPTGLPDTFELVFQNHYVAFVTIAQDYSEGQKVLLESHRLMESTYHENDAQNWHVICSEDFKTKISTAKPLKIYISQSSGMWTKYELRNFKVLYSKDSKASSSSVTKSQDVPSTADSITTMILSDWKAIVEASATQSKLRDLPDLVQQGAGDNRRTTKRQQTQRRTGNSKDSRRASTSAAAAESSQSSKF